MKRRHAYSLALLLLFAASAAQALTFAERVEQQLRSLGYSEVTVSRTLLGRTRIFASSSAGTREIIIDPRNGEILRDIVIGPGNIVLVGQLRLDEDRPEGESEGEGDEGGEGGDDEGGGGGGGGDDDGGDDDDEEDDEDDEDEGDDEEGDDDGD